MLLYPVTRTNILQAIRRGACVDLYVLHRCLIVARLLDGPSVGFGDTGSCSYCYGSSPLTTSLGHINCLPQEAPSP